jgi:hypothetical protein
VALDCFWGVLGAISLLCIVPRPDGSGAVEVAGSKQVPLLPMISVPGSQLDRRALYVTWPSIKCNLRPVLPGRGIHLYLLLGCVYNREVWHKALRWFGWHSVAQTRSMSFAQWWTAARKRIGKPRRKAFDSLVILVAWSLWLERNARIFTVVAVPPSSCIRGIMVEVDLWCCAKIVDRSQRLAM